MGHKRLGDLPNTGGWKRFKKALADQDIGAAAVAESAFRALGSRLCSLRDDPGLGYCFWLLTQVVWQARQSDYRTALAEQKIDIGDPNSIHSPMSFISRLSELADTSLSRDPKSTVFSDIAELAFRETLTSALSQTAPTFFDTTWGEIHTAVRSLGTAKQFGELSRTFFTSYLSRLLGYFIEREVPQHIGPTSRFKTQGDVDRFQRIVRDTCESHAKSLARYFGERAQIVESFAGSYGSLHNYRDDLTVENISTRFIPYALEKLEAELRKAESNVTAQKAGKQ